MLKRDMKASKDRPIQMQGEPAKRHGDKLEAGMLRKGHPQRDRRKGEDARK